MFVILASRSRSRSPPKFKTFFGGGMHFPGASSFK